MSDFFKWKTEPLRGLWEPMCEGSLYDLDDYSYINELKKDKNTNQVLKKARPLSSKKLNNYIKYLSTL